MAKNNTNLFGRCLPDKVRDVINRAYDNDLIKKEIWSKTCSCMDWLNVSSDSLELPTFSSNPNNNSLLIISFITQVDILIESIEQLWLCAEYGIGIEKLKLKTKHIFQSEEFGKENSDKVHFKYIRAWFGVHGVNGNEMTLPNYSEKVRFYSSWSAAHNIDNAVLMLYSNNAKAEKEYGGLKSFELEKVLDFAGHYYNSLEILIKRIEEKLKSIPISQQVYW